MIPSNQVRSGMKIFLCGTDDVKDALDFIDRELRKLGTNFEPIWFHRNFRIDNEGAMESCLSRVKECNRLILSH